MSSFWKDAMSYIVTQSRTVVLSASFRNRRQVHSSGQVLLEQRPCPCPTWLGVTAVKTRKSECRATDNGETENIKRQREREGEGREGKGGEIEGRREESKEPRAKKGLSEVKLNS